MCVFMRLSLFEFNLVDIRTKTRQYLGRFRDFLGIRNRFIMCFFWEGGVCIIKKKTLVFFHNIS